MDVGKQVELRSMHAGRRADGGFNGQRRQPDGRLSSASRCVQPVTFGDATATKMVPMQRSDREASGNLDHPRCAVEAAGPAAPRDTVRQLAPARRAAQLEGHQRT